jgi:hypothetical protein
LTAAAHRQLTGPVRDLHPHLLRHASAAHSYEAGMSLWEVQKMLGHDRPTTTVAYLATARADPEAASLTASGRVVQRLVMDKGGTCREVESALGRSQARHVAAQRPAVRIPAGRVNPATAKLVVALVAVHGLANREIPGCCWRTSTCRPAP